MAFMMAPPKAPGFSLRVQLFAPTAYGPEDKPTRNFRVVIDPEATIQQFCQEASRIHEVNYGYPIAIKRCQDDQGFDITQTELVQDLFASMNTIRVIQASAIPNMRDSVPPTSALRFDPASLLGKRDRAQMSPKTNGTQPPNSYKPNKRQRVSHPDPDQPLASLEEEPEEMSSNLVPNSQESVILGEENFGSSSRQVRPENPHVQIQATPSPPPSVKSETSTDTFSYKFADKRSNLPNEIRESSPVREEQQRSKSKSLGVNGLKERSGSASRTSASPAVREQSLLTNGYLINGRNTSGESSRSRQVNGRAAPAVRENTYDVIESADESVAISKVKKAALKRNQTSPANAQFNTPPVVRHSRENSTPKELALTPQSSKQQQRQKEEANEARKARIAAAEAAEQRKREADEARQAEARRVEQERIEREEAERIEAEELRRDELERVAKEEADREAEAQQVAEEKAQSEKLAKEKAEKKKNARRIASSPLEGPRQRTTSSPPIPRAASTPRTQSTTPFIPTGRKSSLKTPSINGSSPAPQRFSSTGVGIDDNMPISKSPRRVSFASEEDGTPVRPLLKSILSKKPSTPHPSTGNKSKNTSVTPDIVPSKAITPTSAPGQSRSKSITPGMSTPNITAPESVNNRNSKSKTPEMGPPKKTITPHTASSRPQVILPAARAPSGVILPPTKVYSSIVRPSRPTYKASSASLSFSPQVPPNTGKEATPIAARKVITPASRTNTPIPPPNSQANNSKAPPKSSAVQPKTKAVIADTEESSASEDSEESESESESESEAKEQETPKSTLRSPALLAQDSPVKTTETPVEMLESVDEDSYDEGETVQPTRRVLTSPSPSPINNKMEIVNQEDIETQSISSSPRDSRSPVRYNEHSQSPTQQELPAPVETHEIEETVDSSDDEDTQMPGVPIETTAEDEESESEKEDETFKFQSTQSSFHPTSAQKMSPQIYQEKATRNKPTKSKADISPSGSTDTQDEVDSQLISSMVEAVPKSSSPAQSSATNLKAKTNGNASSPLRPSIGFGASLKGMNEKKKAFSSSAPAVNRNQGKNTQTSLLSKLKGAVHDESEDDSSDDSDDSDDDIAPPATAAVNSSPPRSTQLPPKKSVINNNSNEDSSSDDTSSESDSESGSESDTESVRMRTNLLAQIAEMQSKGNSNSQAFPDSSQSPSLARDSRAARRKISN